MSVRKFEVHVLGCGSALPTTKRNPSSQCVNMGEKLFLVDCGEGTQIRLRDHKIRFQRIDHIFISHLHGDHYFGLPGLLSTMNLLGRTKELHLYGPPGLGDLLYEMFKLSKTYLGFKLHVHETQFTEKALLHESDKLEIYSFPLKHRVPCTGFLFVEKRGERKLLKPKIEEFGLGIAEMVQLKKGNDVYRDDGSTLSFQELTLAPPEPRSFAYCSDTKYTETILPHINGVSLLYHEATFLEELEGRARETFHSTAMQAARIAKKAQARKLVIGHYSSRYTQLSGFEAEARSVFENSFLSVEGQVYQVD